MAITQRRRRRRRGGGGGGGRGPKQPQPRKSDVLIYQSVPPYGFTPPRTWESGEPLSAGAINGEMSDTLNFLYGAPACILHRDGDDDIRRAQSGETADDWHVISFDTVWFDSHGMTDIQGDSTHATVRVEGWYIITGYVRIDGNSDGTSGNHSRRAGLVLNDNFFLGVVEVDKGTQINSQLLSLVRLRYLEEGDQVDLRVLHFSEGELTLDGAADRNQGNFDGATLGLCWVGASEQRRTWTAPRTWANGDGYTVNRLNTYHRDNFRYLLEPPVAAVDGLAQTIATGASGQAITFARERDPGNMFSGSNRTRLTLPDAGVYLITGINTSWSHTASGTRRSLALRLNGTTTIARTAQAPSAVGADGNCTTTLWKASAGDYVEAIAQHDAASSNDLIFFSHAPDLMYNGIHLAAVRLGSGNTEGSWTAPPTFDGKGSGPTAAQLNILLRDNPLFLQGRPTVRVYRNSNQSVANDTEHYVSFTTENWDNNSMWGAGNPTRIVFTTAGFYLLIGQTRWASGGGTSPSFFGCWFRLNGSTYLMQQFHNPSGNGATNHEQNTVGMYYFEAGDYVELGVKQYTGGSLNLLTDGTWTPSAMAIWLRR